MIPEYQTYLSRDARERRRWWAVIWVMAVAGPFIVLGVAKALAHEATNVDGYPLGWMYDPGCCRSALEPGGDCAPIDPKYVQERPDGYHINLPKGAHPKLVNKGYSGIVPYGKERTSPEGNYHICLTQDGGHRYCFYAGARGM